MSYSSEVLADSPLAYWRLNETSGTSAADSSGNSRTATYTNSPTLGVAGLLLTDTDKAVSIATASGQCVSIASASWMNVSALTVEALVKFTASVDNGSGDCVVSRLTSNLNWVLVRDFSGGTLTVSVWNNSGTRYNATSSALTNNVTYHVAFTFDGSNLKLYINGSVVATTACTGTVAALADPIEIGRYSGSTSTSPAAVIDEVAIYGSGLSAARISAHYTAATVNPDATVVVPVATATASAAVPVVTASSSVSPPAAGASAGAFAPVVTGTGDATVVVPAASASGAAVAPSVSASASVDVPAATATGAGVVPTVSATANATVAAPAATASAGAIAPFVFAGSPDATVSVPVATATATAHAPVPSIGLESDTSNIFNGRSRSGSATVTIAVPVSPTPSGSTRGTRVDKATPLPLPTLVNGRPT